MRANPGLERMIVSRPRSRLRCTLRYGRQLPLDACARREGTTGNVFECVLVREVYGPLGKQTVRFP